MSLYEIELDGDGVNVDISPKLKELARELPTYPSTVVSRSFDVNAEDPEVVTVSVPCLRCVECDGMVFPENLSGRLAHLTLLHGYRMNGRRYDNENREVV